MRDYLEALLLIAPIIQPCESNGSCASLPPVQRAARATPSTPCATSKPARAYPGSVATERQPPDRGRAHPRARRGGPTLGSIVYARVKSIGYFVAEGGE